MKSHPVRTLLFDLGNVIIDIDLPGAHENLQSLFKKNPDQDFIQQTFHSYERGQISTNIMINQLLSQCPHTVQALDIIEAWNSMLIGIPRYRLDMLEVLRSRYQVYAISNTNELHIEWINQYMEKVYKADLFAEPFFDGAYFSHKVGYEKPDPAIFQFVMEDSFLTPANTLFMDDNQSNIDAAATLGFQTYLVKPGEEIAEYLKLQEYY